MVPRLVLAAFCVTSSFGASRAQEALDVTFEDIVASLDAHRAMYGTNKRIVGTTKLYNIQRSSGQFVATLHDDRDFEHVRDAVGNSRFTVTASRIHQENVTTGYYSTPQIYYGVQRHGTLYAIKDFIDRGRDPFSFSDRTTQVVSAPHSSFDGDVSIEVKNYYLKHGIRVQHKVSLDAPVWVTKFGRGVIAVTDDQTTTTDRASLAGVHVHQTSYFDPANSFAYLGSESAEASTPRRPWASVTTCFLEYEARAGTYPLPKRFTRHVQPEKGGKLLEYEVIYTRFEDYVPDAEDFRLEGRYGLTTPSGPDWVPPAVLPPTGFTRDWYRRAAFVSVIVVGTLGFGVAALRYAWRRSSFGL